MCVHVASPRKSWQPATRRLVLRAKGAVRRDAQRVNGSAWTRKRVDVRIVRVALVSESAECGTTRDAGCDAGFRSPQPQEMPATWSASGVGRCTGGRAVPTMPATLSRGPVLKRVDWLRRIAGECRIGRLETGRMVLGEVRALRSAGWVAATSRTVNFSPQNDRSGGRLLDLRCDGADGRTALTWERRRSGPREFGGQAA